MRGIRGNNLGKELTTRSNRYDTQDSIYDTAWSEGNENQLAIGCGDGSIKLYDLTANKFPIANWQEHNREVYAVSWNLVTKDTFASSSWDGTIKLVRTRPPHASPQSE